MSYTVVAINEGETAFRISIFIQGRSFEFLLHDVPSPHSGSVSLAHSKIECDSELRLLLQGFEEILWEKLQRTTSVHAFSSYMKDVLECIARAQVESASPSSSFTSRVLAEIDVIGWQNVSSMEDDFTKISLRYLDTGSREHVLWLELSPQYPTKQPNVSAELPTLWSLQWSRNANLSDALSQFQKVVESYQEFWNVMEDVDKRAWVIEPDHPSRAEPFRRLSLGGHCSLSVTINPDSPREIPKFKFFGPEVMVSSLQRKLSDSNMNWSPNKMLIDNLETVLEMSIPSFRATRREQALMVECGICYACKLSNDGGEPDRLCDNSSCGKSFHTVCLVEWLHSLSTTRRSFNVLFGSCPYCTHALAVKCT